MSARIVSNLPEYLPSGGGCFPPPFQAGAVASLPTFSYAYAACALQSIQNNLNAKSFCSVISKSPFIFQISTNVSRIRAIMKRNIATTLEGLLHVFVLMDLQGHLPCVKV